MLFSSSSQSSCYFSFYSTFVLTTHDQRLLSQHSKQLQNTPVYWQWQNNVELGVLDSTIRQTIFIWASFKYWVYFRNSLLFLINFLFGLSAFFTSYSLLVRIFISVPVLVNEWRFLFVLVLVLVHDNNTGINTSTDINRNFSWSINARQMLRTGRQQLYSSKSVNVSCKLQNITTNILCKY